jgi:hypothetical protein
VEGSSKIVGRFYVRTKKLGSISACVKLWNIFLRNKLTEDGRRSWNKAYKVKNSKLNGCFLEQWLEIYAIKRCAFVMAKDVGQKLLRQAGTAGLIEMLRSTPTVFLFLVIFKVGRKIRNYENVCACLHAAL